MASDEVPFEEIITDLTEKTNEFIEDFVSNNLKEDPLTSTVFQYEDFSKLDLTPENPIYEDSITIISELVLSRVLADLVNLRSSDNGYNKRPIAVLLDLSFYLKYHDKANYDLPHTLIILLIKSAPTKWLLEFWPYLDLRTNLFKKYKNNGDKFDFISPIRAVGIPLMIALNTRLNQLKYNSESERDFLRAKILKFTSDVFPLFDKQLVNRKFETNHERDHETRFKYSRDRTEELFNAFWSLQRTFQDPFEVFGRANMKIIRDIQRNLSLIVQEIYQIELSQGAKTSLSTPDAEADNREDVYYMINLPDSKREELQEFYDEKDFNPSFLVSKDKFKSQLKNDAYMRRTMLNQVFILCGFIDDIFTHVPALRRDDGGKGPAQKLKKLVKDLGTIGFFVKLKREVLEIFQSIEKRLFFVCYQYREISEAYFINSKVEAFKNFSKEISNFEIDDEFRQTLQERMKYKARFWAKYGNAPISRHWTIQTGLERLRKGSTKDVSTKLEELRDDIKNQMEEDISSEIQVKELLNWKALRLARKNSLFKFKQVNEITGLEGIYDPTIKQKYDEEKAKEEQEALARDRANREALKREVEEREAREAELKKLEEEHHKVEVEELEKKRKASQELFDEESKRVKLESAGSTTEDTALDY